MLTKKQLIGLITFLVVGYSILGWYVCTTLFTNIQ